MSKVIETGRNPIGLPNYVRAKLGFNYTRDQHLAAMAAYMREYGIAKIEFNVTDKK